MQKRAPTAGRLAILAICGLSCCGLLLFLWLSFGGTIPLQPKGYSFTVDFTQAQQLANQADERISGVPVGEVVAIGPDSNGETKATIELQSRYVPAHSDMRAILQQKTLLGLTYIELTPGT